MTTPDPLTALQDFLNLEPTLVVALAARPGLAATMQRLTITDQVAEAFLEIAKSATAHWDARVVREYDAGYTPSRHELLSFSLEDPEHALVRTAIDALKASADLPSFEAEGDFRLHLGFYALTFEDAQGRTAVFLRHTTKGFEVDRSKLGLVFSGGVYDRVDEHTFLFDHDVDCVAWDNRIYISNKWQFERIFDYVVELQNLASEAIDSVVLRVPIANEQEFRDAVSGHAQMLSKVARIARKPYLQALTMDRVKSLIAEFELEIETQDENGQERLVFDAEKTRRWEILKLLDDDFLTSQLTDTRYETNSKLAV